MTPQALVLFVVVAVAAFAVAAGGAAAAGNPPPAVVGGSAVNQYVETIPSAGGGVNAQSPHNGVKSQHVTRRDASATSGGGSSAVWIVAVVVALGVVGVGFVAYRRRGARMSSATS